MFLKRSIQEILKDAAVSIAQNTPITNFNAGSIARSIVEAMAPEIGTGADDRSSLYDFAQDVLDQGFISKAKDEQLNLIGGLFSYNRRLEQVRKEDGSLVEELISDDIYRYELTQIVPAAATANYAALRLALLTINGVRDIIGKEYSHGTGSFSFMLVPMAGFDEKDLVHEAESAIDAVKGYGVRPNIMLPVTVPLDLTVKLMYHESTSETQKANIRFEAKNKLLVHLGNFQLGVGFTYNDLVQEVMNANEKIVDFEILKFYLNNEPVLLTNHSILEDERLIPQNIEII
ncbi:hypothetical protein FU976_07980 [Campylobacter jejuni]|nr:hypothetical protein [Campylobacter jejuni]